MIDMKTRILIPKKKENARKLKKSQRRELLQPKVCAQVKKPFSQMQQNRFTNIHELSCLSSSFTQLQDMFGTLVFDFSKDPVQVKISDVTGNYELNVSKESLGEFKMKILLGQNLKFKPTFSIFLGDCQCYPELPEGPLELAVNEGTDPHRDSVSGGTAIETEIYPGHAAQDSLCTADDVLKNGTFESDFSASLLALFEGGEMDQTMTRHNDENIVSYETRHVRIHESQQLESETNFDEIEVKMSCNERGGSKSRKVRSSEKQPYSAGLRVPKKHSAYKENLEGFVQFLMNDRVCGSLLGKMKPTKNTVAAGKRGVQKIVNYSDGQEYRIVFSQDKKTKKMTQTRTTADDERREEVDGNLKNDEEAKADRIQVLFERKQFEKSAFVEQVKKELEEWKAKDAETVPNVEIVDDTNSSSSSADTGSDDSNFVTVYEDTKTLRNPEAEFDEVTSNNDSEADKVDSTQQFFLDLKEKETAEDREKENHDRMNEDEEFIAWTKSHPINERREDEKFVARIPLGSTSTVDIEEMWSTFVQMFHHSSQLTTKIEEPHPHQSSSSLTESIKPTLPERATDTCTYPGQHCLPYFVEESLRRVDTMLGRWHDPIRHPGSGEKPEETVSQPRVLAYHRYKNDFSPGDGIFFNPKHFKPQTNRSPFHHPHQFSTKRSRIFFNPHTAIGDWYQ